MGGPGPIVPDEHLMTELVVRTKNDEGQNTFNTAGFPHLKLHPVQGSPNPGFPLPGHVMASGNSARTAPPGNFQLNALPGSDVWAQYCQHDYFRQAFTCPP